MKEQNNTARTSLFKRLFIKLCRILGYEIIDQSKFYIPTQKKSINESLSVPGLKSITLPLGETKITRPVTALTVIFRSCTNVNMLTQNKKRLFDEKKSEYTFRSLNSIISSLKLAKKTFSSIDFDIVVIDYNSNENDLVKIKNQLKNSNFDHSLISLDMSEFKQKINKLNAKNEKVTDNQMSNMSNIYKSLLIAKKQCKDLIYFVEDDYLHQVEAFKEMIFSYERISSQISRELILCPADYPYLYTKIEPTNIFIGSTKHWRKVDETLCTFLISNKLLEKYWDKFVSMCEFEHYPFEKPLHEIYKTEYCLSPIPSLALHCTNINSIFGLSPNLDWKKIWENSENH